jgi:ureidoglycolate lyase
MKLKAQPLSAEAFAPFGQVVSLPTTDPTASVEGGTLDYWADVVTIPDLGGPIGAGYATVVKRPFVQTCAERHMHTPEFLQPAKGDMIVVVGPPLYPENPEQLPPLELFAAFRVAEGQAVIVNPGVWHYAPFAIDNPISFTVLFKAGTSQDDVAFVDFSADGVLEIEI